MTATTATQGATTMAKRTRTVGGQRLTLVQGVQYYASRPAVERGRRIYPVTIQPMIGSPVDVAAVVVGGLDYAAANRLINGFNNGAMSFDGRRW